MTKQPERSAATVRQAQHEAAYFYVKEVVPVEMVVLLVEHHTKEMKKTSLACTDGACVYLLKVDPGTMALQLVPMEPQAALQVIEQYNKNVKTVEDDEGEK